jgi:hypothetical protein
MTPAPPHWWQTQRFVLAMAVLAMVPLLWPTIPPLVDLPGHMGRFRVQLDGGAHPWLSDWYGFRWALIGNLGLDVLVVPLTPIFGLELAVKLVVLTIPALTVTGLLWTARELHGRLPATAVFALPIAYSQPLHFGFVNFALSMALALNLFALWLALARRGRVGSRAALFVPLSCALWVVHTYGWGLLGVLAFSGEVMRQWRRPSPLRSLARAAAGCLPLALPLVLMVLWRGGGQAGGDTGDWFNWAAKMQYVLSIFRDRWQLIDVGTLTVLVLALFHFARRSDTRWAPAASIATLILLAMFLIIPRLVFGSAYADMRLAPFVLGLAFVAIRPVASVERATALIALTLFAARIGVTTASLALFSNSYDRELAVLNHVPVGARLVTLVGLNCRGDWPLPRLEHIGSIALERRLAYANDQFAMAGAQLLTTRYTAAGDFAHDSSQVVLREGCGRSFWPTINEALRRVPRDAFDYIWLVQPPAYDARLAEGLTPVWRAGSSVLYRVDARTTPQPISPRPAPSAGRR